MIPSDNPERIAWLSGRLAGLAGTVRYDLSDEDREVLREVSKLLEASANDVDKQRDRPPAVLNARQEQHQ
jgi:hypothetical protein